MKFSTFEILRMFELTIINVSEARQMLKINEHLTPEKPQTGEIPAGSVQDVVLESQPAAALPLSE